MREGFVPADFYPPLEVRIGGYVFRPLAEEHLDADVMAINSNKLKIEEQEDARDYDG